MNEKCMLDLVYGSVTREEFEYYDGHLRLAILSPSLEVKGVIVYDQIDEESGYYVEVDYFSMWSNNMMGISQYYDEKSHRYIVYLGRKTLFSSSCPIMPYDCFGHPNLSPLRIQLWFNQLKATRKERE